MNRYINRIRNFFYSILKKENKHINMDLECTIKKTE